MENHQIVRRVCDGFTAKNWRNFDFELRHFGLDNLPYVASPFNPLKSLKIIDLIVQIHIRFKISMLRKKLQI